MGMPTYRSPLEPKPLGYDSNKYYKFHRYLGNSTNRCITLKHFVKDLIEKGKIEFDENSITLSISIVVPSNLFVNMVHEPISKPCLERGQGYLGPNVFKHAKTTTN